MVSAAAMAGLDEFNDEAVFGEVNDVDVELFADVVVDILVYLEVLIE